MIRELFEDMPGIMTIFCILILIMGFFLLDSVMGIPEHHTGTVVDKHYKPERHSSGTGVGMAGGKTAVVYTSSHESEAFLLMVKTSEGRIETVKCEPELYYEKEIGNNLEFKIRKGRATGFKWNVEGVR